MAFISGPLKQMILFVQEMESEVRFYRDVMGFRVLYPAGLDDFSQEMWVELEVGWLHTGAARWHTAPSGRVDGTGLHC